MSTDGQGTKWRRKIAENFNRLSRAHERYRQTTDGRHHLHSERERSDNMAQWYICHRHTHVYRHTSLHLQATHAHACTTHNTEVMYETSKKELHHSAVFLQSRREPRIQMTPKTWYQPTSKSDARVRIFGWMLF